MGFARKTILNFHFVPIIGLLLLCSAIVSLSSQVLQTTSCPGSRALKLSMKDEFGDEASILREDGFLEIECTSASDIYAYYYSNWHNVTGLESAGSLKTSKIETFTSGGNYSWWLFTREFKVACGNEPQNSLSIGEVLCNEATILKEENCTETSHVCLLDPHTNKRSCNRMVDINQCSALYSQLKVCFKFEKDDNSSFYMWANEVECVENYLEDRHHREWPKGEVVFNGDPAEFQRLCKEMENFWNTDYGLHDIVAVKGEFRLKPNNDTVNCSVEETIPTCRLKTYNETINLQGSCTQGWTLHVTDIWDSVRSKVICHVANKMRWQYYVYPTARMLSKSGNHTFCEWPKWTNQKPTLVPWNATVEQACEKSVQFGYPPPVKGTVYKFGAIEEAISEKNLIRPRKPTATEKTKEAKKGLTTATLIAIIVAVVLFGVLCILAWVIFMRYRNNKNHALVESISEEERSGMKETEPVFISDAAEPPKHYQ